MDKQGQLIDQSSNIRIRDDGKYVSRGGDKLAAAIEDFQLLDLFRDTVVLDVGASTGGFTDCCLQHGAKHVVAVDVGTNQLAWKLRTDPRVTSIEKTDIKDFLPSPTQTFDWVVTDVSFTSLSRLASDLKRVAPKARMLLLVKPQFELPRDLVPTGGVVANDEDRMHALSQVELALMEVGIITENKRDARIAGRSGNREIFILARSSGV